MEINESRVPKIDKIINYKDFFGEYPIIFAIKIISSLSFKVFPFKKYFALH